MSSKFWMVIRPGDCMEGGFYTDKVRYNNFESAKQVAQRVARQLPNYRVVVLEAVYDCAAVHSGLRIVDKPLVDEADIPDPLTLRGILAGNDAPKESCSDVAD